ncbi:hypothetical protein [Mycobacterium sp.]|uniref:hypothetical protein n=1 Tax=Mycobacterium sp. TaxID=1785 RepID=UPI0026263D44|nr:hypothetical protein [Mycobacterium sp.]
MRRIVKTGIFVGATTAVVISGTLVSYASWVLPDPAATAKAQAPSMPAGPTPGSKIVGPNAVVTWDVQQIVPGVKMTAYVVTAHDTDVTPLSPIARTIAASGSATESATFTAAELAGGKWKWAITPKLESWTGTEGPLSNPKLVFPSAAPHTAAAAKAVAAGTGNDATTAPTTPAEPTPTPISTTEAPAKKPEAEPTTSAPEKTVEPEKLESPRAEPSTSTIDPTPAESAS